jgi:hypothetical protein
MRRLDFLWFAACAVLMLSCTWLSAGDGWLVEARRFVVPAFLVAAIYSSRGARPVWPLVAGARRVLLPLVLFLALVGVGGMASHGAHFAAMADDYWHGDLTMAPDRRPVLPALAHLLPPFPLPYAVVWYGVFCLFFVAAWRFLGEQALSPLERFALLTASIAAYLLIVPGYSEAFCFLIALLCWRRDMTPVQICVAAATMIGTHEVAGAFCVLFLAVEADAGGRRAWLASLAGLGAIYVAGYVLTAGPGLGHALHAAVRPAASVPASAPALVVAHPLRFALGIFAAYKLFWMLLPAALRAGGRARLHAGCVMLTLPLALVATDTSRIVQFASLSMFALVAAGWPGLAGWARRAVTTGSLVLPSLYVATNVIPGWGKGFYAAYLLAGRGLGVTLGGMAF